MKIIKKTIITATALFMLAGQNAFADTPNVSRVSGADRYETAYKVNAAFPSTDKSGYAVLASGKDFKNALYGSYLATSLRIPFYTVNTANVPQYILNKLKNDGIRNVYIVGDKKSLDVTVDNQIVNIGANPNRIFDNSVYNKATNSYISQPMESTLDNIIFNKFFPNAPRGDLSSGIVVDAKRFPDLLSSIPFVSSLARRDATFLGNTDYFKDLGLGSGMSGLRFIIGGPDSVPTSYRTYDGDKAGLNAHNIGGTTIYTGRISGDDRYKTAVKIAEAYKTVLRRNIDTVVIVDGTNYPDALASGVISEHKNVAILLTSPKKLNEDTKKYIVNNHIKNIVVVGGENSVSNNVLNELKALSI